MNLDINKINGVMPLLIIWFIIAIASGHAKDIFSINICEWFILFGSLNIISSILIILFNSDLKRFAIKLIIGIFLGFGGAAIDEDKKNKLELLTPEEKIIEIERDEKCNMIEKKRHLVKNGVHC